MTRCSKVGLGLLALTYVEITSAFHANTRPRLNYRTALLDSKLFGPQDFDDGIGEPDGKSKKDGQDLAKDFYEQMRKREQDAVEKEAPGTSGNVETPLYPSNKMKEKDYENRRQEPTTRRQEIVIGDDKKPKVKFTGRESTPPGVYSKPSGQDFFKSSTPAGSSSSAKSPKEAMMEREYQLVDRAERNIFLQAGIAVVALAFYIFVGLSGGIVSGDAALNDDFGGDDYMPFEQIMPLQSDQETSVWL